MCILNGDDKSRRNDINLSDVNNAIKYNEHATFMADIALAVLNGNNAVLSIDGIREIIALYLLIPYITDKTLVVSKFGCKIPQLKGIFYKDESMTIDLSDLRDGICHSFVTMEKHIPGTLHGLHLVFDDRVKMDRKTHGSLEDKNQCVSLSIAYIHQKLVDLFSEVLNHKEEHNTKLLAINSKN